MIFKDLKVGQYFKFDERSACICVKTHDQCKDHKDAGYAGYKEYQDSTKFKLFPVWWQEEVYLIKQEEKSYEKSDN